MFARNIEVLNMARAMAEHASTRQGLIARNIANADTPGYQARDLPSFAAAYVSDERMVLRTSRPGHVHSSVAMNFSTAPTVRDTSPNGNSVSLEAEMVRAADARQQHDMALAVYRSLSGVLRTSLDRGR